MATVAVSGLDGCPLLQTLFERVEPPYIRPLVATCRHMQRRLEGGGEWRVLLASMVKACLTSVATCADLSLRIRQLNRMSRGTSNGSVGAEMLADWKRLRASREAVEAAEALVAGDVVGEPDGVSFSAEFADMRSSYWDAYVNASSCAAGAVVAELSVLAVARADSSGCLRTELRLDDGVSPIGTGDGSGEHDASGTDAAGRDGATPKADGHKVFSAALPKAQEAALSKVPPERGVHRSGSGEWGAPEDAEDLLKVLTFNAEAASEFLEVTLLDSSLVLIVAVPPLVRICGRAGVRPCWPACLCPFYPYGGFVDVVLRPCVRVRARVCGGGCATVLAAVLRVLRGLGSLLDDFDRYGCGCLFVLVL